MQNTVTRLRPRAANYDLAAKAFLAGDFQFSIDSSINADAPVALALRARALLRVRRFEEALATTHAIDVVDLSHQYAAELLILRATALNALKDPTWEAVAIEARARAFSSGFTPVECEVEFFAALSAWSEGRIKEADAAIDRVLELTNVPPLYLGSQRPDYLFTAAYWRARAHSLRGNVHAAREDYVAQSRALSEFFIEFDRAGVPDAWIEAFTLFNLAVLVRDLDSDLLAEYVEDRSERVAYNEFTTASEFGIHHAIAWSRVRRGDHLGAFRALRRSHGCAPTVPQQITVMVDRSALARELGETLSSQEELEYAVRLARQVDWERVSSSDRLSLLGLARLLAATDVKTARFFWDRYTSLKSPLDPYNLASIGDRRVRSDECAAYAAVLAAEGQKARAITLLSESLEILTAVGYDWRAAGVALDLAELTGEAYYLTIARREAAKHPNSLLAKRLAGFQILAAI